MLYVEKVVSQFTSMDIIKMFRQSWAGVDLLVNVVGNAIKQRQDVHPRGKPAVSVYMKVMMLLYYMGTQSTEYEIAHKFGVSDSTVFHCLSEVMNIMYNDLKSVFIKWLRGEYADTVVAGFREKRGINDVIGAIDGSHIRIFCLRQQPADYINRKNFHSIILQAVCDHKMAVTDVYVGWPGTIHNARVFRNLPLDQAAVQHQGFEKRRFLLGDAAYPLNKEMITSLKDTGMLSADKSH